MSERTQSIQLKLNEKKSAIIKYALEKADPLSLLTTDCPADGYTNAADEIKSGLDATKRPDYYATRQIVSDTLFDKSGTTPDKKLCGKIAQDIMRGYGLLDLYADILEADILNGKVDLIDNKIRLTVHDGFIVEYSWTNKEITTLNGKPYYYNIEEQDVLEEACEFCTEDTVYVQYKHKHFFPFWYALFNRSYYVTIQKNKFAKSKLKYKDDIELIFDRNGIIPSD